jgi:transposase
LLLKNVTQNGISSKEIHRLARRTGISARTLERAKNTIGVQSKKCVKEWFWIIKDAERTKLIESMESKRKLPIVYAENADQIAPDIIEMSRSNIENETEPLEISKLNRIFIICEPIIFRGKYDYYAGYIPHTMESNIMNGDAFVFCSRSKSQICILQWQGDGYAMYLKRSEYGKFPWATNYRAQAVEITAEDLKMLTEHPRLMLRLSGKFTPSKIL